MRQIKFRAWDTEKQLWCSNLCIGNILYEIHANKYHDLNDTFVLQQFTGLLDKNGKEIWEGDIMNGRNQVLKIVKWDERRAAFVYIEQFKPKTVKVSFAQMYDKFRSVFYKDGLLPNHEVIGNIYENTDLLK